MEFLLKCTALCMVRQMVCRTTVMQSLSTIAVRLPQNVHTSPIRDSTADRRPASPYTLNEYTLSPIIFSIWYMIFITPRSEFIPFLRVYENPVEFSMGMARWWIWMFWKGIFVFLSVRRYERASESQISLSYYAQCIRWGWGGDGSEVAQTV